MWKYEKKNNNLEITINKGLTQKVNTSLKFVISLCIVIQNNIFISFI